MSRGRGLVLALYVLAVPGKLGAVDHLLFSEISRQVELAGLVGLEQARGGIQDSQKQGTHS